MKVSPVLHFSQVKTDAGFTVIPGATDSVHITCIKGVYRLVLFTTATSACPMYSNIIIVNKTSNDCLSIKTPTANNDV